MPDKPAKTRGTGKTTRKVSDYERAIIACKGNMTAVGISLGVSRQQVYNMVNKHDILRKTMDEVRESQIDVAESKLHELIDEKNAASVHFYLKTIGKNRGYVDKSEIDGTMRIVVVDETEDG